LVPDPPALIVILGPTGVGKSRTGLALAGKYGGEIIACDSMQVYRGFDIGTDKPSPSDRERVRHHLVDVADPRAQFTAADFVAGAVAAIADIRGRGGRPFIVGGTGLYLRALLDGLFPGAGRDPEIRRRLEVEAAGAGLESLFRRLEAIDPAYARVIRSRDKVRIIRALEVHETTGRPISEHFRGTRSAVAGWRTARIGLKLDRAVLNRKIDERVDRMFEAGLVAEVEGLLAAGIPEGAPPFRALGYRWVVKLIKSEIGRDEAIAMTKLDTRHYAKRQMTWFGKMEGIAWFDPEDRTALEDYVRKNIE
jgi:tRNA dimethylallyltransferase